MIVDVSRATPHERLDMELLADKDFLFHLDDLWNSVLVKPFCGFTVIPVKGVGLASLCIRDLCQ